MKIALANGDLKTIQAIEKALKTTPHYELCWVACNAAEMMQKCALHMPDLLLLDIVLLKDEKNADSIKAMMSKSLCAILLTTNDINEHASQVFEAMGHGALDVVTVVPASLECDAGTFLRKISLFELLLKKPLPFCRQETIVREEKELPFKKETLPFLILIGASTGGPVALATILSSLPCDLPASIVIVQHVDQQFVAGFAQWLREKTPLSVDIATEGSRPTAGFAIISAGDNHLIIDENLRFKYTREPRELIYRPSIDVLFSSAAKHWPDTSMAILLTGMGRDGAQGLKLLANAGWHTIVEHEKSCTVYGMPKAAIEMQAAKQVLPLETIAQEISAFIKMKTG